jgi:hypothetical protein
LQNFIYFSWSKLALKWFDYFEFPLKWFESKFQDIKFFVNLHIKDMQQSNDNVWTRKCGISGAMMFACRYFAENPLILQSIFSEDTNLNEIKIQNRSFRMNQIKRAIRGIEEHCNLPIRERTQITNEMSHLVISKTIQFLINNYSTKTFGDPLTNFETIVVAGKIFDWNDECCICLEKYNDKRDGVVMFSGCGHTCCAFSCFNNLQTKICPICRNEQRVFITEFEINNSNSLKESLFNFFES